MALQLSEFVATTRHIIAVAEEVQPIAHRAHMAHVVRLKADLKQFALAASRTAEAAAELQLALMGAGLAPMDADPATLETPAHERGAGPARLQMVTEPDEAAGG